MKFFKKTEEASFPYLPQDGANNQGQLGDFSKSAINVTGPGISRN